MAECPASDTAAARRRQVSRSGVRCGTLGHRGQSGPSTPGGRCGDAGPGFVAWRSIARYTVERPTPNRSATSAVLYSPLCTRETRWAWRRLSLGCLPRFWGGLPLCACSPKQPRTQPSSSGQLTVQAARRTSGMVADPLGGGPPEPLVPLIQRCARRYDVTPVSYTHLTLPTI